jgi:Predicted transcriptional regulators
MINVKVGDRLRELRKCRGLSQEALADECGLDRTYITYIENAKKSVTISTLYKVTSALNITLKEFFSFEEGDVLVEMKDSIFEVPELIVGKSYTNEELSKIFQCSNQGGIRVSSRKKL